MASDEEAAPTVEAESPVRSDRPHAPNPGGYQPPSESELRLRGIVEQSFDGIVLIDEEGLIIEWNPAQERIYGIARERAVGRPLWDLQAEVAVGPRGPSAMREQMRAMLQQFQRTGEAPWLNRVMEWQVRRSDGTQRAVQQIMFSVPTERGFRAGAVTRDVTERLAAEDALRRSEELFRSIAETTYAGIWVLGANGETVYANQRMADLVGMPPAMLLEADLAAHVETPEGDQSESSLAWVEGMEGGPNECLIRRVDGRTLWALAAVTVLRSDDGRTVGALAVFTDITQRKQADEERHHLEEQVRRAQKLESLGLLAGGIAHDFNNLLVAILGNADLALMDLPPDSQVRELVADIRTSSMRAADLSRQMLTYSGRGGMARQRFDVNQVVQRANRTVTPLVARPEALQLRLTAGLPQIVGDPAQVEQVVSNLLSNALDALGDRGGTITVGTGLIHATEEYLGRLYLGEGLAPGEYVSIEVHDTGLGMDEDTLRRIFDPFFSTKGMGRGLGLPVVHGVVSAHRGAIEVGSAPGAGSTFRVLLPVGAEEGEQEPATDAAPQVILVVDDEVGVRAVAKRVLERTGYTVLTASDGLEAVEMFRRHADELALVLLDLTMPRMAGEAAFREIHATRADVPVLLLSGYSEQTASASFADMGIAGFMQKPFTPADLCARVRQLLPQGAGGPG